MTTARSAAGTLVEDGPIEAFNPLDETIPAPVVQAMGDNGRRCPMFAGAALVRGRRLTVRTAGYDVEVQAPVRLLSWVFRHCDGTRAVDDILANLANESKRSELRGFIEFLFAQGALIDANLATVEAARYAVQGSPFGKAADTRVTDRISCRFGSPSTGAAADRTGTAPVGSVPLDVSFESRFTCRTFDDRPVSARDLQALAWSLAGVVQARHEHGGSLSPRRTVASAGGMYLVQVYIVLQRPVEAYAPGVYRVRYPHQRAVALEYLGQGQDLLPRAFGKPWELSFATGAVFLVADPVVAAMRYRNRALQYLFMEAGAILHNGALSAPQLGLGYAILGGYYESIIIQMCGLGQRDWILGAAIFGPLPMPQQLHQAAQGPEIEFAWADVDNPRYRLPFHMACAKVRTPAGDRPYAWGRDVEPGRACLKAMAEAIEREGFREPRDIVVSPMAALATAVDPRQCVCYARTQYARKSFPYQPFDAADDRSWASGTDMSSGMPAHVLAELVFSRRSLEAAGCAVTRPYTQTTSSGCAAGTTLEDALLRALLELIERDAFMRHWLAQQPGLVVPRRLWPAEVNARVAALEAVGCRVNIQRLESPWAHVCLVAAQHEAGHFTTMGTAADVCFLSALTSALSELESRVYAWLLGHHPSISTPAQARSTEHHFELYGLKPYYRRADNVLFAADARIQGRWPSALHHKSTQALIDRFAQRGLRTVAVDITPRHHCIDQGRQTLVVVKALVPGLLPISFGHGMEPEGMVPRVHPAARFPHPFP